MSCATLLLCTQTYVPESAGGKEAVFFQGASLGRGGGSVGQSLANLPPLTWSPLSQEARAEPGVSTSAAPASSLLLGRAGEWGVRAGLPRSDAPGNPHCASASLTRATSRHLHPRTRTAARGGFIAEHGF